MEKKLSANQAETDEMRAENRKTRVRQSETGRRSTQTIKPSNHHLFYTT